jgi:hypothetical protein
MINILLGSLFILLGTFILYDFIIKLNAKKMRRNYNTRFIQFGRKYKAFAKVVPSGKTVIYALQMAKKHLALLVAFR